MEKDKIVIFELELISLVMMRICVFLIFVLSFVSSFGSTLDEAKKVYLTGNYEEALPLLEEQYKKNKRNASVNQWIGVCLFNLGRYDDARDYFEYAKSRKVVGAYKYLALLDFYSYKFDDSKEMFGEYRAGLKRLKKEVPKEVVMAEDKLSKAKIMLDHVEKIAIIDSIVVDKENFFEHYKLSLGAGSLNGIDILPFEIEDSAAIVFEPESKSRLMWGMSLAEEVDSVDGIAEKHIYETQKLYDGSWDRAIKLDDNINIDGDSSYPYMMSDGTTLYYANNGSESIGGYDIFISRKDSESGKFYYPQNIGMPFNSPFDDYLLVIDEFTGVGWWATDRNQIPGKVTIYVFVPQSVRVNYSPEDPNLMSFAKIEDIKSTWDGNDYTDKLQGIKSLSSKKKEEHKDFVFHLSNDVTYTRFEQFKNSESRHRMDELMVLQQNKASDEERLHRLRLQYSKVSEVQRKSLAGEILRLEKKVDAYPDDIERVENAIRRLELK